MLNELLGIGIGAFQGMTNIAINGLSLVVLYYGGSLLASREMEPGDLMSFLVATQTIQRYYRLKMLNVLRKIWTPHKRGCF